MGSANIWVGWTPNGIAEGVYSSTKKESGLRVRPVLARDPPGAPQCIPERVHPPQPFPRQSVEKLFAAVSVNRPSYDAAPAPPYATTESPSMRRVTMPGCTRLLKVDRPARGLTAEMRKAGQLTEEGSNGAIGASTAPLWQQSTKEYAGHVESVAAHLEAQSDRKPKKARERPRKSASERAAESGEVRPLAKWQPGSGMANREVAPPLGHRDRPASLTQTLHLLKNADMVLREKPTGLVNLTHLTSAGRVRNTSVVPPWGEHTDEPASDTTDARGRHGQPQVMPSTQGTVLVPSGVFESQPAGRLKADAIRHTTPTLNAPVYPNMLDSSASARWQKAAKPHPNHREFHDEAPAFNSEYNDQFGHVAAFSAPREAMRLRLVREKIKHEIDRKLALKSPAEAHAQATPSRIRAALATTSGKVGLDSARWYGEKRMGETIESMPHKQVNDELCWREKTIRTDDDLEPYVGTAIKRTTKAKLIKEYAGKCFLDPAAFPKRSMHSVHAASMNRSV